MKNSENRVGFGDVLLGVAMLLMIMKWTGVTTISWLAICNFNIFTIIYLLVTLFLDVAIKIIDAAIEKKRDDDVK